MNEWKLLELHVYAQVTIRAHEREKVEEDNSYDGQSTKALKMENFWHFSLKVR